MVKIYHIETENRHGTWFCSVTFTVETANQFTPETHHAVAMGKGVLSSLWRGWREAKKIHKRLRAKRGEREALGWY